VNQHPPHAYHNVIHTYSYVSMHTSHLHIKMPKTYSKRHIIDVDVVFADKILLVIIFITL